MKKRSKDARRKSFYNDKRDCYLSLDGKFYCYRVWDESGKHSTIKTIEVGKDLSVELTIMLDESDHDIDLNDRYEHELRNSRFDSKVKKQDFVDSDDDEDVADPWETLADKSSGPEDILFAEPDPENPQVAAVRRVIDEDCTEAQKDFFFEHFGNKTQLEEMRQAEAAQTGKLPSPAAMNNRKNKILDKVAKALGVERVKRRKPKQ